MTKHVSAARDSTKPADTTGADENLPEVYTPSDGLESNVLKNPSPDADLPEVDTSWKATPGSDLPEPYAEGKIVHTVDKTEHGSSQVNIINDEPVKEFPKKILGVRRRIFLVILIVFSLVTIGAIVGGVVGSRSSNESSSVEPPSSPTVTTTGSLPTSTPGLITWKDNFKYPSVALVSSGNVRTPKLFTLHNSNNSITFHIKGSTGWTSQGTIPNDFPPAKSSSLTAFSWTGVNEYVRLYYIDNETRIIELSGTCQSGSTACEWTDHRPILDSRVSNTTGLAVLDWGNGTSSDPHLIRLYYSDETNNLCEMVYDGIWSTSGRRLGWTVESGGGLSAEAQSDVNSRILRVFFMNSNNQLAGLRADAGYQYVWTEVNSNYATTLASPVNLATCLVPDSQNSTKIYLKVKQIAEDGSLVEASKVASVGDWPTNGDIIDLDRGDDPGGAIACNGYIDQDQSRNQLVVYSVNGSLTEFWQQNGIWTSTTLFDD